MGKINQYFFFLTTPHDVIKEIKRAYLVEIHFYFHFSHFFKLRYFLEFNTN